jgi:hypothetical protein
VENRPVRADPEHHVNPLRVAVGLARFGVALSAALIRLAVHSAHEPDPIDLQPKVLLPAGAFDDDGRS